MLGLFSGRSRPYRVEIDSPPAPFAIAAVIQGIPERHYMKRLPTILSVIAVASLFLVVTALSGSVSALGETVAQVAVQTDLNTGGSPEATNTPGIDPTSPPVPTETFSEQPTIPAAELPTETPTDRHPHGTAHYRANSTSQLSA